MSRPKLTDAQGEALVARIEAAYAAGHDCARHGANTTNCDVAHFTSPGLMGAWQQGYDEGNERRAKEKKPC